jgi:hypothetical protein
LEARCLVVGRVISGGLSVAQPGTLAGWGSAWPTQVS